MNRIKKSRGVADIVPDVQKVASLNKQAGGLSGLESALGLLLATVFVTGGITGFNWQRSNSPQVAKYKAYKKGLETYNKHRSLE